MPTPSDLPTNALLLRAALADIFRGRSFCIEGAVLTPQQAFDPKGFLPLFVARAARRFKGLYGEGIKLSRCIACGLERPLETCDGSSCPLKRGERRLRFPFRFLLLQQPDILLGTIVEMAPHRNGLFVAMFLIQDVAMEMLQQSADKRMISVAPLLPDLVAEISPLVVALREQESVPATTATPSFPEPTMPPSRVDKPASAMKPARS